MTPTQELIAIFEKQKKVIAEIANDLISELIAVTPEDTGALKVRGI